MIDFAEVTPMDIAPIRVQRPDRGITADEAWRRAHGYFRDQIVTLLYRDSGDCFPLYATLETTLTGNARSEIKGGPDMVNFKTAPKPVETELESVRRGRKAEEVDLTVPKQWLVASFEGNKALALPYTGVYKAHTSKPRKDSGKQAETVFSPSGEAQEVANALRAAAEELNLGVSVEFVRKGKKKTDVISAGDKITGLKFQAQERRKYTRKTA
jgi:hypothetical protein